MSEDTKKKPKVKVKSGDILVHKLTGQKMMVIGRMMEQPDAVIVKWGDTQGHFGTGPSHLWEFEGHEPPEKTLMYTAPPGPQAQKQNPQTK